ncbi:MAG: hypothetical protein H0X13_06250 [Ramlibacter sp.]|nr:hypothetical protein [Ramlibacter sp.]
MLTPETAFLTHLDHPATFKEHIERDLKAFWCRVGAAGTPPGNFPSYLCDDGTPMTHEQIVERTAGEPSWIRDYARFEYCRTRSRNLFGLCAIFHATGDRRVLGLMRQTMAFIRDRVLRPDGTFVHAWDRTTGADHEDDPNSQEFALLMQGFAFYFFLTRDPGVLEDIWALFGRLDREYRCPLDPFLFTWAPASRGEERRDLRGVLDHLNSYMLLLSPVLPTGSFAAHIRGHVDAMWRHFYEEQTGQFRLTCRADGRPEAAHTDCGHTVKAFWVTYLAGKQLGDSSLIDLARAGLARIAQRAFMSDHGGWCINFWPDGTPIEEFEWWSYALFDQALATLSLEEPGWSGMLNKAYGTWFSKLVDHRHGEVFHNVVDIKARHVRYPKVHLWKDAYHSCEHALIGYLTSSPSDERAVYFAIEGPSTTELRPYLFRGEVVNSHETGAGSETVQQILFRNIRC